ncbi:hemerythrin domain-containing protein [Paracoccus sp. MC1862]|uniref:hemerythrin domain-containing protein n=2 Tax=Paracoccus sp. MC1862 TaxID=2760307 RepID=UPI00190DA63F|nr:hemerythrin domain-containing protein [Paracoccus sp. MC1862]QQO46602.1 hemerythrin domain-containing protein [Paracoccus sp. MC1862]
MTTIQQLMQTGQLKANEIFAKLAETPLAARTRDRLVSDLKVEFDRQAEFEEQRLLPVLRENRETKDLVAAALNDNQQMRKLLGEIERSPRDGEAFGTKVAEFRDLFQRRFRDDRNEILPAVVKALSDAEAGTAASKTEGGTTGITPARRAGGRENPMTDAARQSGEIMKAGMDVVQQGAQVARRAMGAGTDAAGGRDRGLQPTAVLGELQETAREAGSVGNSMMALLNEQALQALQVQTSMAAGRIRTLAEMAQMQSAFMAGSFQRMGQINDRYLAFLRGWGTIPSFPSARR